MSKWIRGIYNSAANFNMSRSLRAASTWFVGRNREHVREEHDEPNQCDKSGKSCESCGTTTATASSSAATCACATARGSTTAAKYSSTRIEYISRDKDGNDIPIALTITAREQNGIVDYTYSAERERASTGVRISDEPRNFKQTTPDAGSSVEHCTGIPTGVTI